MTVNAQKRAELGDRRRKVAALYLRKMTQEDIAGQLHVSQATISRDVRYLGKQWAAAAVGDMDVRRGRELAELQEMERDCALQFASTKDSRWLRVRMQIKERIAKLLGLDRPIKVAPTDPTGERAYGELTDDERLARIKAILKLVEDQE